MGARHGGELARQIALLDQYLYAPGPDARDADASDASVASVASIEWDGKALWRAFAAISEDEGKRNGAPAAAPATVLQSLHPAAASDADGER